MRPWKPSSRNVARTAVVAQTLRLTCNSGDAQSDRKSTRGNDVAKETAVLHTPVRRRQIYTTQDNSGLTLIVKTHNCILKAHGWKMFLALKSFLGHLDNQNEKTGHRLLPFEEPRDDLRYQQQKLRFAFVLWPMRFKTKRKYRALGLWCLCQKNKLLPNRCSVYSHFHATNHSPDFSCTHEFIFFAVALFWASRSAVRLAFFGILLFAFANIISPIYDSRGREDDSIPISLFQQPSRGH